MDIVEVARTTTGAPKCRNEKCPNNATEPCMTCHGLFCVAHVFRKYHHCKDENLAERMQQQVIDSYGSSWYDRLRYPRW